MLISNINIHTEIQNCRVHSPYFWPVLPRLVDGMSIMPSEEVPQPLQIGIGIGAVCGTGTLGHTLSDSDGRPFMGCKSKMCQGNKFNSSNTTKYIL